jgi:hypothetical protein
MTSDDYIDQVKNHESKRDSLIIDIKKKFSGLPLSTWYVVNMGWFKDEYHIIRDLNGVTIIRADYSGGKEMNEWSLKEIQKFDVEKVLQKLVEQLEK